MLSLSPEERVRWCLAMLFAFLSWRSLDYNTIAALFFIFSWIFYVLLRYRFSFLFLALPFLIRFFAGFLYGFILVYLMVRVYPELDETLTVLAGFLAVISIEFLLLSWSEQFCTIFTPPWNRWRD